MVAANDANAVAELTALRKTAADLMAADASADEAPFQSGFAAETAQNAAKKAAAAIADLRGALAAQAETVKQTQALIAAADIARSAATATAAA